MSKYPDWYCAKCTNLNKHFDAKCSSCEWLRDRRGSTLSPPARSRPSSGDDTKYKRGEENLRHATSLCNLSGGPKLTAEQLEEILDVAKAAGAEPEENSWKCSHCTRLNPPYLDNCATCRAQPPPEMWDVKVEEETLKGEHTLVDTTKETTGNNHFWNCQGCTFKNDCQNEKCLMCETPRPADVIVPADQARNADDNPTEVRLDPQRPKIEKRKDVLEFSATNNRITKAQNVEARQLLRSVLFSSDLRDRTQMYTDLHRLVEQNIPVFFKECPPPRDFCKMCFLEITVCFQTGYFIFFKRFMQSAKILELKNLVYFRYGIAPDCQVWLFGNKVVSNDQCLRECGVTLSPMYFPVTVYASTIPMDPT